VLAAAQAGRRLEARTLIDSGYLDLLGIVIGLDQESIRRALQRWLPLADRISLSVPWFGVSHAEQVSLMERLLEQAAPLKRVPFVILEEAGGAGIGGEPAR